MVMKTGYKGITMSISASYHAPYRPAPETWQSYLRRLGNGLNGIHGAGGTTTVTEADIVANAEKYMQIRYPGPYRVEQYYNPQKMKWDLRLQFADPQEQTVWLLRWS